MENLIVIRTDIKEELDEVLDTMSFYLSDFDYELTEFPDCPEDITDMLKDESNKYLDTVADLRAEVEEEENEQALTKAIELQSAFYAGAHAVLRRLNLKDYEVPD